jgi:hypothetical protein
MLIVLFCISDLILHTVSCIEPRPGIMFSIVLYSIIVKSTNSMKAIKSKI